MNDDSNRTEMIRALFYKHSDEIYRYAKYSLPPDFDARDVVQEVFLRAFRSWKEFRGIADPKTWLFRIARNHIYDLLRTKRRRQMYEVNNQFIEGSMEMDTIIELQDALSKLQPSYQQVLNLRWIQDLSVTEVAQVLGWSESKVRMTFHRARRKLRELLKDTPDDLWSTIPDGGETAHGEQGE